MGKTWLPQTPGQGCDDSVSLLRADCFDAACLIANIKKANNSKKRRTNESNPEEKHKRGMNGGREKVQAANFPSTEDGFHLRPH